MALHCMPATNPHQVRAAAAAVEVADGGAPLWAGRLRLAGLSATVRVRVRARVRVRVRVRVRQV